MQANPSNGTSVISGFVNLVIVAAALVIMYYSFKFFYGDITDKGITILSNKIYANQGTQTITNQSKIYEGGEYTVNLWLYLSGWKKNYGTRKHVLQLGGSNFSTLLIALGAFKNSLMVRTHTASVSGGKTRDHFADYPHRDASGYDVNGLKKKSGSAISTAEMNAENLKSKAFDKGGINAHLAAGGDRGAAGSAAGAAAAGGDVGQSAVRGGLTGAAGAIGGALRQEFNPATGQMETVQDTATQPTPTTPPLPNVQEQQNYAGDLGELTVSGSPDLVLPDTTTTSKDTTEPTNKSTTKQNKPQLISPTIVPSAGSPQVLSSVLGAPSSTILGQALQSSSPDPSTTGSPILDGDGGNVRNVWNTESLRTALGL